MKRKKLPPAPLDPDHEDLDGEPVDPMVPYPLRLPRSLVDRIRTVAEALSADPELRTLARGRVTSGAVARLALTRGLDSLERDGLGRPPRAEG